MHKTHNFVTFEQAQVLKDLGFDWACHKYFLIEGTDGNNAKMRSVRIPIDYSGYDDLYSVPSLCQVREWMERQLEMKLEIHFSNKYFFTIEYGKLKYTQPDYCYRYEQALSAGIDKAIQILKQQNNGK